MGNTVSNPHGAFKRSGSIRISRRKPKEKRENPENPMPLDEPVMITHRRTEEKATKSIDRCLQDLEKDLSCHDDSLDRVVKETVAQKTKVNEVLQLLLEYTNVDDASQEERIARLNTVVTKAIGTLKDIQSTQSPIKRVKDSFRIVRRDIGMCQEQIGKDASIIDTQHDKPVFEKLYKEIDDLRDDKLKLEEQVKCLRQTVSKLEHANKELRQREIRQPTYLLTTVQIFYIHESDIIKEIEKEIKIILKSKLGAVNFITCPNVADIDKKKLLIAICIVSTRLGADAARVIKNIQDLGNVALLVIHFTETYSLPNQIASRHLTDQEFKNLRGIFDMSFKLGNGFFQCDLNERSINELCSFCKQPPLGDKL